MHANALTPGEYIKAAELGATLPANPTWTIDGHSIDEMASLKPGAVDKMVEKGVLRFREIKRGWVMNKTNVQCLIAMFGGTVEDWHGKRVTLKTEYQPGVKQPGIRIQGSPDIAADMTVRVVLPRKKPIEMRLVKTGGGNTARAGNGNGGNTNAAKSVATEFLAALAGKCGVTDADKVRAIMQAEGLNLDTTARDVLLKAFDRFKPGGDLRAKYDAPPADQGGDQDEELPPGEGRAFGDEPGDDTP